MLELDGDWMPDLFWRKVSPCPITGCWLWLGTLNKVGGRPQYSHNRKGISPREYISRKYLGKTDKEKIIDVCGVKACVRPDHWKIISRDICKRGHNAPRDSRSNCSECNKLAHRGRKRKPDLRRSRGRTKPKPAIQIPAHRTVFGDKPPVQPWRPNAPGW